MTRIRSGKRWWIEEPWEQSRQRTTTLGLMALITSCVIACTSLGVLRASSHLLDVTTTPPSSVHGIGHQAVSLLNLVPHTPWASKLIEHWDYASVAGITRTILELRLGFHYLCDEECSDDEWDCRWNVLNLHDCTSRKRMFESTPDGAEQVAGFDTQAEELRGRIRANLFFQVLPAKKQKRAAARAEGVPHASRGHW